MKICIAGKNRIAVDAIHFLLHNKGIPKENIIGCINKTDSGEHGWQPSFKKMCEQLGVQILTLEDILDIADLLFLSLEFDKIIKPEKFKSKRLYNIHFSKLPAYKGMYTSIMPILRGEKQAGVTLHLIDNGIDTGAIIDQIIFDLYCDYNSSDLYELFLDNAKQLIEKNLDALLQDKVRSTKQEAVDSSYFSKNAIDFSDIVIDLRKTAFEIKNQIRAFAFRAYQLPSFGGVKISHAIIENVRSEVQPGRIVFEDEDAFLVSSIDYNVWLYKDCLNDILETARVGNIEVLNKYFNKGYKMYEKNEKGWNPLIVAAYHEQLETCKWLLQKSVSPNSSNINGTSTLMYAMTAASKSNRLDLLELLLKNGARIEHKDLEGRTVLDYAVKYNNDKVIDFLYNYV